jgi:hypothetical protein
MFGYHTEFGFCLKMMKNWLHHERYQPGYKDELRTRDLELATKGWNGVLRLAGNSNAELSND